MTRRPHSHADEMRPRTAPNEELPMFRPAISEAELAAKDLRARAAYARKNGLRIVEVSERTIQLVRAAGALEPPVTRITGEITPSQAERYAAALDPVQGAA